MGMKPRSIWDQNTTADIAKPISGCVNQPKTVDEFSNVEQTNTKLKVVPGSHAIPGVVASEYEKE